MSTGTVLVVLTKIRPEERAIINALEAIGLNVIISVDGRDLGWLMQGNERAQPQVALLRCLSQSKNVEVSRMLKACGIHTINSNEAISICCSKIAQALIFRQNDIPAPASWIAFCSEEIERYGEQFGFNFVLKPSSSSWGRGVTLIRSRESLEAWLSAWETHDAMFKHFPILIQEFVDKPGYDLRVVVVDGEPLVAFRRETDHWKTNTHLGASVVPCEITEAMRALTVNVVEAIGPGIYGLDLFEQRNSPDLLVCEVNQNPEFARSSQIHGVDIASAIAAYAAREVARFKPDFWETKPVQASAVAV
ncbi:RimK family alpha-L-glutamate ligase [Chitinimonas arctica]|nr:RimK family alpha-L-glutamate ligase [Chitinimonas arctica]